MPATPSPNQNHLLAALPTAEFELLAPHLELVALPLGEMLYEPDRQLQHAYFPTVPACCSASCCAIPRR